MLDEFLIKYASPTLAGIKSGSLFKVYRNNKFDLDKEVKNYNSFLNSFDLYLNIIYSCDKYYLIYVYKLQMILYDFSNKEIINFLAKYGYHGDSIYDYICFLKKRFSYLKRTPHEIGVFLGYPLKDVLCFIKYKGKNFKFSGCWKVYNDVDNCRKKFQMFRECRDMFLYLYKNNYNLENLIL